MTKARFQVTCGRCTLMTEASLAQDGAWEAQCTRCKQELALSARFEIAHQYSNVVALLQVYICMYIYVYIRV